MYLAVTDIMQPFPALMCRDNQSVHVKFTMDLWGDCRRPDHMHKGTDLVHAWDTGQVTLHTIATQSSERVPPNSPRKEPSYELGASYIFSAESFEQSSRL